MANYRGQNLVTKRVWYTGRTINATRASSSVITLTNGLLPMGAVLVRDPFAFDQGGSRLGDPATVDANPAAVRTGTYEGIDYTQPQTGFLNQHKVVVVDPGIAPPGNPNGGRWITVIEAADAATVLTNGTVAAGDQLGVTNGTFAASALPVTSVAELVTVLNNGIGVALETNSGGPNLRSAKISGGQNPSFSV